jgi:hypothetical protein
LRQEPLQWAAQRLILKDTGTGWPLQGLKTVMVPSASTQIIASREELMMAASRDSLW